MCAPLVSNIHCKTLVSKGRNIARPRRYSVRESITYTLANARRPVGGFFKSGLHSLILTPLELGSRKVRILESKGFVYE